MASTRAPGCRPGGREPTLPAAALGGGLRCLPPRSASARSEAPGTAPSRPTEAFPAPSWGIPLPSRVPRKGSNPPRRRGSLLRTFAPPPLPPALCLWAPHPRGRALGVPFRDGVKHTGSSAGLPRLTPPAINFALTGDAVSPSSDRRGRLHPRAGSRRPDACRFPGGGCTSWSGPRRPLGAGPPGPGARPSHAGSWPARAGARRGAERARAAAGELAGSRRELFWQDEGAVCRGGAERARRGSAVPFPPYLACFPASAPVPHSTGRVPGPPSPLWAA